MDGNQRNRLATMLHQIQDIFTKVSQLEGKLDSICESNRKLLMLQTDLHEMQTQCRSLKSELTTMFDRIDKELDKD